MFATEATASPTSMPPLPPQLADLTAPELLKVVLEEVGEGCGLDDFREHPATCHFTADQVKANIGAAKRLLMLDRSETHGPSRPLMPWDADPSYRKELVRQGGRIFATGYADPEAMVEALLRARIEPEAMIALWDDFVTEGIAQLHRQPRLGILAGILATLDAAVAAYDTGDLNAEARNLVHTMRSALDGLRQNQAMPRAHVLATVSAFAHANEWSSFDPPHQARVKSALALLTKLWGL